VQIDYKYIFALPYVGVFL